MKLEYIDEYNDMSEPEKSLKRLIGILKYLDSDYIDVKEVREELKALKRVVLDD